MNAELHLPASYPVVPAQAGTDRPLAESPQHGSLLSQGRRGAFALERVFPRFAFLLAALAVAVLAGCGSTKSPRSTLFDFGPATPAAAPRVNSAPMPVLVVTEATGSAAFESERMFYRLDYADARQAHSYANSRWNSNPQEMVTQRLKTRVAQSGTRVLSTSDASAGVPILRVEIDDFIHAFDSETQSVGRVVLRASLFHDHALVDQKTFSRAMPAPTANAAGGARALAESTDAIAADIVAWLAAKDLRKR